MANKYQEALDKFKGYKNICIHRTYYEDIETLQELVNWYEAFEKIGTDYTKAMIERYLENENKNI